VSQTTYTGSSLEEAVRSGALERPGLDMIGMVKASEESDQIQFARGGCETWLDLPTKLIDQAEHLGQRSCRDHTHPVFRITLKEPKDPTARIFASLLAVPVPASSQAELPPEQYRPGYATQMQPPVRYSPAFRSSAVGANRSDMPRPMFARSAIGPGLGTHGSGRPPALGAWGCWDAECCDCVQYEHVDNGTAEWDVCVQWSCYPCQRCVWPW
jgi:hypothetical protein